MGTAKISVRHQEITDHERIVDYFLTSEKDFLIGMGVDIAKLPERQEWLDILQSNFSLPIHEKKFFYVIWLLDNQPIGHSNVNKIVPSEEAYMHLHLWQKSVRKKGLGIEFLTLTIPIFFETFSLKRLYCEPLAANVAPNKALDKLGFDFVKSYETIPGWINTFQTVNRWCLSNEKYLSLYST
jgi:RimJ/RimL family protein N-acetyltransferase